MRATLALAIALFIWGVMAIGAEDRQGRYLDLDNVSEREPVYCLQG